MKFKPFLAVAVLSATSTIGLVNTVAAAPFCEGEDPPPICSGETPPKPKPRPVPAPRQDYPEVASFLLNNSGFLQNVITTVWNTFGRGVAAQKIEDEVDSISNVHDVDANLRNIGQFQASTGPGVNQFSMTVSIPGNNVEANYHIPFAPDPSFRVYFDIIVNLTLTIDRSNVPIKVDVLTIQAVNSRVSGSNIIGTIVKFFGDLFTGGNFSNSITSRVNQDINLKPDLARYIQKAIDELPIPRS